IRDFHVTGVQTCALPISGAPARLRGLQEAKQPREGGYGREMRPVDVLARRNPVGYSRDYSRWLNPLYEPGMSTLEIAERWLEAEDRKSVGEGKSVKIGGS